MTLTNNIKEDSDFDWFTLSIYVLGFGTFAAIIGFDLATLMPLFLACIITLLSVGLVSYLWARIFWSRSLPKFESRVLHELVSHKLIEIDRPETYEELAEV